jgi:hypothetical protein
MSPAATRQLEQAMGVPVLQGAAGSGDPAVVEAGPLRPGSTITVPLIMGDIQAQSLGTVTEVIGPEVFAFGHHYRGEGPTLMPMASGYVYTFVSRMDRSFKLGRAGKIVGSLRADETTAIYGRTDLQAPLTPLMVEIAWPDRVERFDLQMARDSRLSPVLTIAAIISALEQRGGLPRYHTLEYEIEMEFDGVKPLRVSDISAGANSMELGNDVLTAMMPILGNPWQRQELTGVTARVRVASEDRSASLLTLTLERRLYHPGQMVRGQVEVELLWEPTARIPFEFALRDDLPEGAYELHIGTQDGYRQLLQRHQSQRLLVFSADDVQRVLQERLELRRDRLYVTMVLPGDGLALESQALAQLPASQAMLLTDPTRTVPTAQFQPLQTTTVDTPFYLIGDETLKIEVSRDPG